MMSLFSLFLAAAFAGDTVPCPLAVIPTAKISWTDSGDVSLYDGAGKRLQTVPTGTKFGVVTVNCHDSVAVVQSNPLVNGKASVLRMDTLTLDFAEAIEEWKAFDPVWRMLSASETRRKAGDYKGASAALDGLSSTDERVITAWRDLGRAALAGGDVEIAARTLEFGGFTAGETRAINLAWGKWLIGQKRSAEGLFVLKELLKQSPEDVELRLVIADTHFQELGEADDDYLAIMKLLPVDKLPPEVGERCKPCAKAIKKAAP